MSENFVFDVVEESKKVWNCESFNRRKRQCGALLCTGVYDCHLFREREDKEDAPKKWIKFCVEVHRGEPKP